SQPSSVRRYPPHRSRVRGGALRPDPHAATPLTRRKDSSMVDNVIAVRDIRKAFAGVQALQEINLEIAPGEIHCLAGENGSGKSTLIKVISGVYTPDSGTISLNGQQFSKLTPLESISNGVQVIYQDFSVFPNLSVLENLALNAELEHRRSIVSWRRMRRTAEEALGKLGVAI